MQLTVTPRVEGILQVVGVGWKLSDSVVGFHKFESIPTRRKNVKGRQRSKHFLTDNLKFVVIKVKISPYIYNPYSLIALPITPCLD